MLVSHNIDSQAHFKLDAMHLNNFEKVQVSEKKGCVNLLKHL